MIYELLAYNTDRRYDWDVRYREYTASKRRAEAFAKIPRIQFTDSGHGIVFSVREHKGKRLPTRNHIPEYIREHFKVGLGRP